ncbi:type IV toxin-antitoxin system AbiEi family antitoxin domain-containing protein [Corynebacterium variabile]|uniref:type IV toxin-antitoxin system AbiEi family antitoxin domain-containing protein n=1 Tax=Corynebacterium variabile TaxID=1727 RepID=UPI003FD69226
MKGSEAMEIVGDLSSQQWGLVTSAQAQASGVDLPSLRRLENRGGLVRVRHGVYATTATALSAEVEIKAQWLALRPELMAADRIGDPALAGQVVVSHTTAAEMWGIGDLWPDGIHFTVGDRRRSRQPDVRFHRADLTAVDWVIHPEAGLPVTTVARTIVDLAHDGHEPEHLLSLVGDAGRKSLLEEDELLDALAGHEDSLGVDRGDRRGLRTLLDDYFPEGRVARRTRSVIDEAMRPVRAQMDSLLESLRPTLALSDALTNPLQQYTGQLTSPMQTALRAANVDMFPDLAETIRKMTGVGNLTGNVWDNIYPTGALLPSVPQLRSSRSRRQQEDREDTDASNAGNAEVEDDTPPDHRSTERGGEGSGQEPQ